MCWAVKINKAHSLAEMYYRPTFCTRVKSSYVMAENHNGKVMKFMRGHQGTTEGKNQRRGSNQGCIARNYHQGSMPKDIPAILVSLRYTLKQCLPLPGLLLHTLLAWIQSNPIFFFFLAIPLVNAVSLLVTCPSNYSKVRWRNPLTPWGTACLHRLI